MVQIPIASKHLSHFLVTQQLPRVCCICLADKNDPHFRIVSRVFLCFQSGNTQCIHMKDRTPHWSFYRIYLRPSIVNCSVTFPRYQFQDYSPVPIGSSKVLFCLRICFRRSAACKNMLFRSQALQRCRSRDIVRMQGITLSAHCAGIAVQRPSGVIPGKPFFAQRDVSDSLDVVPLQAMRTHIVEHRADLSGERSIHLFLRLSQHPC